MNVQAFGDLPHAGCSVGWIDIQDEPNWELVGEVLAEMMQIVNENFLGRPAGLAVIAPVDSGVPRAGRTRIARSCQTRVASGAISFALP
jgi:hypothetical protein